MQTITLEQAIYHAAQGAWMDAHNKGQDHAQRMQQAREHWNRRKLTANIDTGTVRDRDGVVAQFTAYDWADNYTENPAHIYFDFFASVVRNSADRIRRGFEP